MSEASTDSLSRIISRRQFVTPVLLPATLAAAVSALCLAGLLLTLGGLVALINTQGQLSDADLSALPDSLDRGQVNQANSGLLPVAAELHGHALGRLFRPLIVGVRLLHTNSSALVVLILFGSALLAVRWALQGIAENFVSSHVSAAVRRLREHIHRHSLRLDTGDLTGARNAATTNLFQNSASQLERDSQDWGWRVLCGGADLAVLLVLIGLVNLRVGAECLIPIVVCWYVLRLESSRHDASQRLLSEQVDRGLERLAVGLRKTRTVSGYGMESFEQQQFETNLQQYGDRCAHLRKQRLRSRWTMRILLTGCAAILLFILVRHLLVDGAFGVAAATVLLAAGAAVFLSLKTLQPARSLQVSATVASNDVHEYLRQVPAVGQVVGARFLEPMARTLQFDQITFESDDHRELLKNLDLRISSGERVALLSMKPAEVSALVSLIPRFSIPKAGQVLIDGQNIQQATLESLRAEVMIATAENAVFNATVLENITCGQADISRQDAIEASKLVHAESFIRQLPHGYEAVIGEHGHQLEVGQVYRLSLARAVARNPALLIIEEPTAALDAETKAMLDDAYQRISANRTVIFLPTRLSTVKKCDRVVMLSDGRVAVDGRHDDLVRTSELYRHWEYVNFNVFRN
ncbi:MAG: ABC transporter ATP-binding protein [Planctomycetaceae bacterium]